VLSSVPFLVKTFNKPLAKVSDLGIMTELLSGLRGSDWRRIAGICVGWSLVLSMRWLGVYRPASVFQNVIIAISGVSAGVCTYVGGKVFLTSCVISLAVAIPVINRVMLPYYHSKSRFSGLTGGWNLVDAWLGPLKWLLDPIREDRLNVDLAWAPVAIMPAAVPFVVDRAGNALHNVASRFITSVRQERFGFRSWLVGLPSDYVDSTGRDVYLVPQINSPVMLPHSITQEVYTKIFCVRGFISASTLSSSQGSVSNLMSDISVGACSHVNSMNIVLVASWYWNSANYMRYHARGLEFRERCVKKEDYTAAICVSVFVVCRALFQSSIIKFLSRWSIFTHRTPSPAFAASSFQQLCNPLAELSPNQRDVYDVLVRDHAVDIVAVCVVSPLMEEMIRTVSPLFAGIGLGIYEGIAFGSPFNFAFHLTLSLVEHFAKRTFLFRFMVHWLWNRWIIRASLLYGALVIDCKDYPGTAVEQIWRYEDLYPNSMPGLMGWQALYQSDKLFVPRLASSLVVSTGMAIGLMVMRKIPYPGKRNDTVRENESTWRDLPQYDCVDSDIAMPPILNGRIVSPSRFRQIYDRKDTLYKVAIGDDDFRPIAFGNTLNNQYQAVQARILKPPPPITLMELGMFRLWCNANFDVIFPRLFEKVEPCEWSDFIKSCGSTPSVRRGYQQACARMSRDGITSNSRLTMKEVKKWTVRSSFVKVETLPYTSPYGVLRKAPRLIQGMSSEVGYLVGPFIMAVQRHVCAWMKTQKVILFASGFSNVEVANFLRVDEMRSYLENDVSAWDVSMREPHFDVEIDFLLRFHPPRAVRQILEMNSKRCSGRTTGGLKYSLTRAWKAMRFSGDFTTALMNSIMNILIHLRGFARIYGLTVPQIMDRVVTVALGDDNAVSTTLDARPGWVNHFSDYGMKTDVVWRSKPWDLQFCSMRMMPCAEGWAFVPKAGRVASKIGYMVNPPVSLAQHKQIVRGTALSLLPFCTCSPPLVSYFNRILSLTLGVQAVLVKEEPWRMVAQHTTPNQLTQDCFNYQYRWGDRLQEILDEDLNKCSLFSGHPGVAFQHLCLIDTDGPVLMRP